jgi:hypothetical protein
VSCVVLPAAVLTRLSIFRFQGGHARSAGYPRTRPQFIAVGVVQGGVHHRV